MQPARGTKDIQIPATMAGRVRTAVFDSACELFVRTFGSRPRACGFAPGRVNLIGEHIDYSGGFVLPMAIERQTVVVGRLGEVTAVGDRPLLEVVSAARPGEVVRIEVGGLAPGAVAGWASYVAGFSRSRQRSKDGACSLRLLRMFPWGAGLSSSAAIEVSAAMCLHGLYGSGEEPDLADLVGLCRKAEHEYAGVPCGIMDQYVSAMAQPGRALLIDCHGETHREVSIAEEVSIVVADCGVKHALADGEYAKRRASCERALAAICDVVGPRETLRHCTLADLAACRHSMHPSDERCARHAITECARTLAAAEAMEKRAWDAAGELLTQSHQSLRDDYQVSCSELDALADYLGQMPGVFGARMTGGGFGGCVIALAMSHKVRGICDQLSEEGRSPLVFATRPAGGAGFGTL